MPGIQLKDLLVLGNSVSVDKVWTQERMSPWIEALRGKHEKRFLQEAGFTLVHKSESKDGRPAAHGRATL